MGRPESPLLTLDMTKKETTPDALKRHFGVGNGGRNTACQAKYGIGLFFSYWMELSR